MRGGLDVLVQLADQLVALVQQVVGRVATALARRDLLVELGDLVGQVVDGRDIGLQLLAAPSASSLSWLAVSRKRRRISSARVSTTDARRQVGRRADDVGEGVEHVADRGAQAVGAAREQALELLQLVVARARRPAATDCASVRLARQEVVVGALRPWRSRRPCRSSRCR